MLYQYPHPMHYLTVTLLSLLLVPLSAFADVSSVTSGTEDIIFTFLYYLSAFGYFVAALMMGIAITGFGRSSLGSAFTFIFYGTAVFFIIAVFQTLGGTFFEISDESMDIWWHLLFYLAFILYFVGLHSLVRIGKNKNELGAETVVKKELGWKIASFVLIVAAFTLPSSLDPFIMQYAQSPLAALGLHHFIAFIAAAVVALYLVLAKQQFGVIGNAIAAPMSLSVGMLAIQHFWELLTESWKVIVVSSYTIEGVEKIFLFASAVCMLIAAWRLKTFTMPSSSPAS